MIDIRVFWYCTLDSIQESNVSNDGQTWYAKIMKFNLIVFLNTLIIYCYSFDLWTSNSYNVDDRLRCSRASWCFQKKKKEKEKMVKNILIFTITYRLTSENRKSITLSRAWPSYYIISNPSSHLPLCWIYLYLRWRLDVTHTSHILFAFADP